MSERVSESKVEEGGGVSLRKTKEGRVGQLDVNVSFLPSCRLSPIRSHFAHRTYLIKRSLLLLDLLPPPLQLLGMVESLQGLCSELGESRLQSQVLLSELFVGLFDGIDLVQFRFERG